jgi:hypothetical protein
MGQAAASPCWKGSGPTLGTSLPMPASGLDHHQELNIFFRHDEERNLLNKTVYSLSFVVSMISYVEWQKEKCKFCTTSYLTFQNIGYSN